MKLNSRSLVGDSVTRERVKNDYYATPFESTISLLENVKFDGDILESCIGGGHIATICKEYGHCVIGYDLVYRGYQGTNIKDFLTLDIERKFDNMITNPPYKLAQEFLEKGMEVVKEDGKIAMFLKIQFLEGVKRKKMFEKYPPKEVLVFSKRQNPWRNGNPTDENGKPWNSTMCFAWFIWEVGYTGETIIKWI